MSDASQGPGWWHASDGKWYPPEQQPGYAPPPPHAPVEETPRATGGARALPAISTAGLVVGALLPWAVVESPFGTLTANGVEGDGIITLVLGLLVLLAASPALFAGRRSIVGAVGVVVFAGLAALIGISDLINVESSAADIEAEADSLANASAGIGLWLTAIAGVLGVFGGLAGLAKKG